MMLDHDHLALEESYVLGISMSPYRLELDMDFVLTPEHPSYHAPGPAEQECYRRGVIRIENFRRVIWNASNIQPSTDANGEADYGNLDNFHVKGDLISLSGDWGEIEIYGGSLTFELSP
jgi:hypothetical protein